MAVAGPLVQPAPQSTGHVFSITDNERTCSCGPTFADPRRHNWQRKMWRGVRHLLHKSPFSATSQPRFPRATPHCAPHTLGSRPAAPPCSCPPSLLYWPTELRLVAAIPPKIAARSIGESSFGRCISAHADHLNPLFPLRVSFLPLSL